jgi:hypothetical protein
MKLSRTSKLDGIMSWSLNALDTCPGSVSTDGGLVPACQGCYATTGNYVFSNVRAPREHNKEDWQRDEWVDDMAHALHGQEYFRWFDSGDMYALPLAYKIYMVMRSTPWCRHWLPTRMHKFKKFLSVIRSMEALDNVVVRRSSDAVDGSFTAGLHGSTIVPSKEAVPRGVKVCEAYEHGGKCSGCRACWVKSFPVVAYVAHGRKMSKIIRLMEV